MMRVFRKDDTCLLPRCRAASPQLLLVCFFELFWVGRRGIPAFWDCDESVLDR